jgi:hypothetical protein
MFTDHWNLKEIEVKDRLFRHGFILAKNHEFREYQVLKLDDLDGNTESVLNTDLLDDCLSVL